MNRMIGRGKSRAMRDIYRSNLGKLIGEQIVATQRRKGMQGVDGT